MSEPFVGEIRAFGFPFAPFGWMFCNGQLLAVSQYQALFAVLGTTFGGNGTSNFAVPNLQGTAAMHWGNGAGLSPRVLGESLGETSVTLLPTQIPSHTHALQGAAANDPAAETGTPGPSTWLGYSSKGAAYINTGAPNFALSPKAISPQGGNVPHNNIQPVTVMNFCIAYNGIFPPRG